MAARTTRARIVAAVATLGLIMAGLTALAWGSDVDDDGPEIDGVQFVNLSTVIVTFDEAIRPPSAGDFAFEHFGQDSDAPHIHRPTGVTMLDDHTVQLDGVRPLHPGVTLPLVAAYVADLNGNVSAPQESFAPPAD
jgi:hypothetical protein